MTQSYHNNAITNFNIRNVIQNSDESVEELSIRYNASSKTIYKWRGRDHLEDRSSRPHNIQYSLTELDKELIKVVRICGDNYIPLDEVLDICENFIPNVNRSNLYRTLKAFDINKIPEDKKREYKKFKEYEPGFIHIDVTYGPKLEGDKKYLFVAIDRATRSVYFKLYDRKTAKNAESFLEEVIEFFPFSITHILTDNGAEFTNIWKRRIEKDNESNDDSKSNDHIDKNNNENDLISEGNNDQDSIVSSEDKKRKFKDSLFDIKCKENNIEHRLTKPHTPKTNGMVERINDTIKSATLKANKYSNYKEIELDLYRFLIFYNFNRLHSSLKRELKVRTPYEAIEEWYKIKPEIFKTTPQEFKDMAMMKISSYMRELEQRCET